MSVRGWVQSCVWEPDGSALVASVASGGTVLSVENVGDFDDGGGEVEVNGQRITYSADAIDFTANTITLDAPGLSAAAAVDDWVSVVSGGQTVIDPILSVSLGDGEPARVVVPFEQRDKWPEGDYDPPVEVLLSDDLTKLEAAPGRLPWAITVGGTATAGKFVSQLSGSAVSTVLGERAVGTLAGISRNDASGPVTYITLDTGNKMIYLLADVAEPDSTVLIQNPSTGGYNFTVQGTSYFAKRVDAVGELHGNTVHVDSVPTTIGNAANVYMGPSGKLYMVTSSERYKKSIRDAKVDVEAFLGLRRVSWISSNPEDGDGRFVGFLTEDVDAAGLEELVVRDAEGKPKSIAYPTMVVHLHAALTDALARIDALTERVAALEAAPSSRSTRAKKE